MLTRTQGPSAENTETKLEAKLSLTPKRFLIKDEAIGKYPFTDSDCETEFATERKELADEEKRILPDKPQEFVREEKNASVENEVGRSEQFKKGIEHFKRYIDRHPLVALPLIPSSFPEDDLVIAMKHFSEIKDIKNLFESFTVEELNTIAHRFRLRQRHNHLQSDLPNLDGDYSKLLLKAAELGSANAQYFLGQDSLTFHHSNEQSIFTADSASKEDKANAIIWLTKAAEQGNCKAMYALGKYYEEKDIKNSLMWFEKAIKAGHPSAKKHILPYVAPTPKKLEFYNKGIEMIENCLGDEPLSEKKVEFIINYFKVGKDFTYDRQMIKQTYCPYFPAKKHESLNGLERTVVKFIVEAADRGSAKAQYILGLAAGYGLKIEDNFSF